MKNDRFKIEPHGPVRLAVRPPGSKSIACRALVCAALAEGESCLEGLPDNKDVRAMIESLRLLGVGIHSDQAGSALRVIGRGGCFTADVALNVADSGATARFLTAAAATGRGVYRIDGSLRMRQRPMRDLLNALRQLGGDITSENRGDRLPLIVRGQGLRGGRATVSGSLSSQFLSALLLASPRADADVELRIEGDLVSRPYVAMTSAVMRDFGVDVGGLEGGGANAPFHQRFLNPTVCRSLSVVAPRQYVARRYTIEPDASSASYFFAAAAITRGEATVLGLSPESIQSDLAFCECLERMGCEVRYANDHITVIGCPLNGIDVDMNSISDTAPTLAVTAIFADSPTVIRNVAHMRHKESDRIHALAVELRRLGAEIDEFDDGLKITPGPPHGAEVDTYNDHRMAMSLSLAGLIIPGVVVRNPFCVEKTYPGFFRDMGM